jgi:predicted nucleic acid-binding protein
MRRRARRCEGVKQSGDSDMITVVLDANVLFPMLLRDTLLRCAAAGLFQIRWSSKILEEMTSNLIRDYGMPAEAADALRQIMDEAFSEAMIDGWEEFGPAMRNDNKDRYVAAAAAASGAVVIVTANTRDFYDLPAGIDAAHPTGVRFKFPIRRMSSAWDRRFCLAAVL